MSAPERSTIRCRLDSVEFRVLAPLRHERLVGTDLGHAGAVEDDDVVGHSDSAEAMGHEDRDSADGRSGGPVRFPGPCGGGETLEEGVLRLGVECGGRLIEDQE